jgi:hypothetical protein
MRQYLMKDLLTNSSDNIPEIYLKDASVINITMTFELDDKGF